MALVAARFRIVAEDTLALTEIPPVQRLPVADPPAFGRSMILGDRRAPGHGHGQRPLPFQFGFLHLLAGQKDK